MRLYWATIVILFFSVHLATAQEAALTVSVVDNRSYERVADYEVTLSNEATGFSATRTTDSNGQVTFRGLSTSGTYIAEAPDTDAFLGTASRPIRLVSGQRSSVILTLFSAEMVEMEGVEVRARSTQINTVDGRVSSELSAMELETLPVEGRDITRALFRLPNISQATGFFNEANPISINGANSLFINFQLDGFDNNENFLGQQAFRTPVGVTQNITTLTNNFSAEHGETANGIVNITTRSGSNEFEGEGFFVTRPGPPLDSSSPFAQRDLSGNQVQDGFSRYQGGFSLGGPIIRDRTTFFVSAEHTTDTKDNLLTAPDLGVNTTVEGINQFTLLSGRIDHRWTDNFRSFVRANVGLESIERQGGGLEGGVTFPSAGNAQNRNSVRIAQRHIYNGGNFLTETGYQYAHFRWDFANPNNPDLPNVTALGPDGQPVAIVGHPGFLFDSIENTHQLQQSITLFAGGHTIKAGGQFKSSGFSLTGGGNPNGSWVVQLTEQQVQDLRSASVGADLRPSDLPDDVEVLQFTQELRPNAFEDRQNIVSLYVEDQFNPTNRLSVNVGLRWKYDDLTRAGGTRGDFTNFGPRLSANYRLNATSSIRAGYGMHHDKILYAVHSDALQFSSNSDDFKAQVQALIDRGVLPEDTDLNRVTNEGNLSASVANADFLDGPDREALQSQRESAFSNELRIKNPNGFQNPVAHQFMLGYQWQIAPESRLKIDLLHNRSYNLFRLRDLNAPEPFTITPEDVAAAEADPNRDPSDLPRTQGEADATRPVVIGQDEEGGFAMIDGEKRRGVARSVIMSETEGRSNYWAANVTYEQERGDRDYALRLIYTLSSLRNNTEDINFRARDANNFEDEWAPALNDRRHMINGTVTYFPVEGLSASIAGLLQSGQPINRVPDASVFGTDDLNGDGRSFSTQFVGNNDRTPGEGRNSDRLPWSVTFDLNVRYGFSVGTGRLVASADVFNLFNAENLGGFSANLTQSNQIQTGPAGSGFVTRNVSPPRQFQFGLQYLF